jgi:hypothetical protein
MYADYEKEFKQECRDEYLNSSMEELSKFMKMSEATKLSKAINGLLEQHSNMRKLFDVKYIKKDSDATYQILEFDTPQWILPSLGFVSQDLLDVNADTLAVPIFSIQAAKSWLIKFWEEKEDEVLDRAVFSVVRALMDYETEAGWRTIIPAITSKFDGAGILPPRPPQMYEMPPGDRAAGYFSKELINRMIVGMARKGHRLSTLLVSPEDLADIREYSDVDVDPITRREIFESAGAGTLWGINLIQDNDLGIRGKFNIGDKTSEWGPFKGNAGDNRYNDYHIVHGNVVDQNGNLVIAGETQIYGFAEDHKMSIKMPIKKFEAHWDPSLLRRQQIGFYGWQKMGLCCLDNRFLSAGVIDRFVPGA